MWRHYYDHRYPALVWRLYRLGRCEYGFSPLDSVRLAYYAGRAAQVFQPTRSRAEAQRALPFLESYYRVARLRGGETFDVPRVARLELEWWQLRREQAAAAKYAQVIAQVWAQMYAVDNGDVRQAARLRADMMDYWDERRDDKMRAEGWVHIEAGLVRSYERLRLGITTPVFRTGSTGGVTKPARTTAGTGQAMWACGP